MPERRAGAVALVVAAITSIQFGSAFAATLFDSLGPGGTTFLRLALAASILVVVVRPRVRGHAREDLRAVAAFGLVLGVMNWSFYESIDRIPLGVAVTIEFVGPLGVAVAGSRRPLDLVWVVLAGAGIALLALGGGSGPLDPAGVALAVVAGACWAAYILLSARVGRGFPGASGLALAMVLAAAVTVPAGVVQGGGELLVPGLVAAGFAVALASTVIPYSLELHALRTLPTGVFGVLMSLEPGVAAAAGLVVLGQDLAARDLVAIACVVAASAGAASLSGRWEPSSPAAVG